MRQRNGANEENAISRFGSTESYQSYLSISGGEIGLVEKNPPSKSEFGILAELRVFTQKRHFILSLKSPGPLISSGFSSYSHHTP
jgi:hypothetical protein